MVVLSVDFSWYPMGTGSFFHSFFSTICYRLENQKWGRLYPCLMNELYQGKLETKRTPEAMEELRDVQNRLNEFAPTDIIWDIENLSMKPPWAPRHHGLSTMVPFVPDYIYKKHYKIHPPGWYRHGWCWHPFPECSQTSDNNSPRQGRLGKFCLHRSVANHW